MKKDIWNLLKLLGYIVIFAYFLWESIDFAFNAKADTEGYYNLLGNKLLPYQVLPYRIISSISIPLWLVGILVTLRFAIGKVADLIYKFKKYMKTRFNK
jgi:hypothetical protein